MKEISPILRQKAVPVREVPNCEHISGNNWSTQAMRKKPAYQILDTAKAERTETVACLRGSSNYFILGDNFPTGVLLAGPPGTAKSTCTFCSWRGCCSIFFAASTSDFVEMFVGRRQVMSFDF